MATDCRIALTEFNDFKAVMRSAIKAQMIQIDHNTFSNDKHCRSSLSPNNKTISGKTSQFHSPYPYSNYIEHTF